MANNVQQPDWDDLGRSIQEAVDKAIGSRNFEKLNQTISDLAGRAADAGAEAVRRGVENASRAKYEFKIAKPNPPQPKPQKVQLPDVYAKTGGLTAWAVVRTSVGGIVAAILLFVLLTRLLALAIWGAPLLGIGSAVMAAVFVGFTGLMGSGISDLRKLGRFNSYRRALGANTQIALEKLARSVGKPEKFVRREVKRMIGRGLFLAGHLNKEETFLLTTNETYRNFERSRLELEERKRQEA